MQTENQEITKEEIKKEFQLERMILFSDAVFAIVITLMAIEIHLPELPHGVKYTEASFLVALKHLWPIVFAYALSFFFIGQMWYKHLQLFALLKEYNKGLVIRNLIFLFFIGLFPFGASMIVSGNILTPFLLYLSILICCFAAQILLQDYIVNRSKGITINTDFTDERIDLKKKTATIIVMVSCGLLALITAKLIENSEEKPYAFAWIIVFVIAARIINTKNGAKK
ncbi:MAG: TMEM175 family protein [Pedobacter sp.]|nr:TMEM175 family protein [Pedobacter sp.]MDQ8053926.1 TMEM175 family protein [Pedobacter sp.]